jgi:hypothetical protein
VRINFGATIEVPVSNDLTALSRVGVWHIGEAAQSRHRDEDSHKKHKKRKDVSCSLRFLRFLRLRGFLLFALSALFSG